MNRPHSPDRISRGSAAHRTSLSPIRTFTPARSEAISWGALLIVLTFLAYLPALSAGFIWDDDAYVTKNTPVQTPGGLRRIWFDLDATIQYYPLVFMTFWIEHQLWNLNPVGYHAINIVLHGAAAVLLWRLLRRLNVPGAWLAGAIFAVHPVHVESVAWVTERKNVLSVVFYLSAAIVYLRFMVFAPASPDDIRQGYSRRNYFLSLALFICALLSKTATVALPVAILLIIWWKRGRVMVRDLLPLVPFFAVALVAGLVTSHVERGHVGAASLDWTLSAAQRFIVAGRAICHYLATLAWPGQLAFIYGRWDIDPSDWRQYLFPLAVIGAMAAAWLVRGRMGRGAFTAGAFFIVTLLPTLGFVKFYFMNYSFVADHFQYLADIGPISFLSATIASYAGRQTAALRTAIRVIGTIIGCVLALLTWQRCAVFRNNETLWNDVLVKSPAARYMAHQNLAMHYFNLGQFDETVRHDLEALRLKPGYPDVHENLAQALQQLGRIDEAIVHEQEALRQAPDYLAAACNLGFMLESKGRIEEAEQAYTLAIQIDANSSVAHFNYGRLLARFGKSSAAAEQYREVLRIDPNDAEAAHELAALRITAPSSHGG